MKFRNRVIRTIESAPNERAWAVGVVKGSRFHIRRVVWGRLLARAEKREGEVIRRVTVLVTGKG